MCPQDLRLVPGTTARRRRGCPSSSKTVRRLLGSAWNRLVFPYLNLSAPGCSRKSLGSCMRTRCSAVYERPGFRSPAHLSSSVTAAQPSLGAGTNSVPPCSCTDSACNRELPTRQDALAGKTSYGLSFTVSRSAALQPQSRQKDARTPQAPQTGPIYNALRNMLRQRSQSAAS